MKTILALFALVAVVASTSEYYQTQYENFDANQLVENVRLLKNYIKCFLDEGPCTPEGNEFKKAIPDALQTNCSKCSPKQRELIRIVVKGFQEKLPELWEQLSKKEDPRGEYKEAFNSFINSTD
uniref:Chemosensory protein 8 n=1 Tax=Antheraea yamamai TaxID=7121 RepID=E7EC45_ANTYA|nr:chemosensory protein 8 [Antheraea yamamai]